ncbi:hemolysin III [Amylibacter kogurei]|uniref:Hemolysin III n=1 Tax=Paramylibacter kogurei TaxID=1889778 RepID=A0A2G5K7D8_9RHOB|nr:hemolysin III family protein [Amylibacter kogurei]PIB25039.1 hemolysin III [Amylibacter kogurei]
MEQRHPNYYPPYSRPERVADGMMHALGIIGSLVGGVALLILVTRIGERGDIAAATVYAIAMVFAFSASALYHFTPIERLRPTFRKFDHAAIFLKIAGTYTPLVVLIGGGFSYSVLCLVWLIALGGMIWKVFFWQTPNWKSTLLYLALGWLSLALAWPIIQTMPIASSALIAAGGLTYTAGVVFYRWDSLRYSVAIWHGFVLAASACLFSAIILGQLARAI